ncbi:ATP phosphoribosyltransferase regulatory subunit [Laribacter hongkongensis]|uniref:ATP phosphoribosyltransferase regulatory subunit n=1 Tax=Laribacter hongkongensis TaxID=168471 RepID=UPI001EFCA056|nr:ATP phosphoribosyltransferase regulatory subunit [Laribacter hongkongensis]MCG9094518.1 ATP phosphoribosyltransferase regulatory subunit [Laribacter hongkongensis]MCG9114527.1 ATP phosphoribosyltransferase regulatory subunit [Laribacter hongkongensis]
MHNWLLPEHIADILPATARQLESAKAAMLERFRRYGYELVSPPLIEYTDSLLTNADPALDMQTFKLDDQLSGRQLGLRADMTPQVARIDAHLLAHRQGVTRLCYAGSVVHTRASGLMRSREPLQVGAELYGCYDLAADIEIIELMLSTLAGVGIDAVTLDLGHLGVYRALVREAQLDGETEQALFAALQAKDRASVKALTADVREPFCSAFRHLVDLYGPEAIGKARARLPGLPGIRAALDDLERLAQIFASRARISFDLTELRGTHYHTGLMFAAYAEGWAEELARGGRYDNVGRRFGRARPATGFSLDLRDMIRVLPQTHPSKGIRVRAADLSRLADEVARLRAAGEVVVVDYLGETAADLHCDRELVCREEGQSLEAAPAHP